ncbi:MAG: profilin, required for normal timing of actin polymerization in response to thermal stress [Heterodermia speciosa]|uniref:Profilin n=1 Tax=Heterodermia speciosa TaxID=116794 RepID=A0A8H3I8J6_9LECA|nr:MAG: profilin, required for normal timing of actin polymerization in response to thermal stress [Heterodermia speciosa]
MSWQGEAFPDLILLVSTGNIDKAAIFNAEGTSVWASSPGFQVAPAEIKEVVASYKDTPEAKTVDARTHVKKVESEGFHIGASRYVTIKADERSLYGKKGKEGVVIVKTTQAILVAHYPETVQPGSAANTVEQLGDYLISVGY